MKVQLPIDHLLHIMMRQDGLRVDSELQSKIACSFDCSMFYVALNCSHYGTLLAPEKSMQHPVTARSGSH